MQRHAVLSSYVLDLFSNIAVRCRLEDRSVQIYVRYFPMDEPVLQALGSFAHVLLSSIPFATSLGRSSGLLQDIRSAVKILSSRYIDCFAAHNEALSTWDWLRDTC